LIDSQEKIELKNFEGNSEALDNLEVEFLDSTLSETEFEVFENGKLGKLPNIRKDRLEKILKEQFGQITINYSAEKLRDLARIVIKEKIENKNKEIITGNQFSEVKPLENTDNHNLLEWSYSQISGDGGVVTDKLTHKLTKEREKMDLKKIIHRPDYFGGKSSEDNECFIEKFELISIVNGWGDTEKTTILPLYLADSAASFAKVLKIRNHNLTWDVLKGQLIENFTLIGNKHLLRVQINQRKVKEGETLMEYIIYMTQLCYKFDRNMTD